MYNLVFISDTPGSTSETLKVQLTNVKIIKKRSLDTEDLDTAYPAFMPFYLYGTPEQPHIDHMLLYAPNIQLTAGRVKLALQTPLPAADLEKGVIVIAENIREASMQPFPAMIDMGFDADFFFSEGKEFDITIYQDPFAKSTLNPTPLARVVQKITSGKLTLEAQIYVDSDSLNSHKELAINQFNRSGQMSNSQKMAWVAAVEEFDKEMHGIRIGSPIV